MNVPVVLVEAKHGVFIVPKDDRWVSKSLIETGDYSPAEHKLWQRFIRPGMTVFDVGANCGYFSVRMAQMVGDGKVVSVEPVLWRICAANLMLNVGKLCMVNAALSDMGGTVHMKVAEAVRNANWGALEIADGGEVEVPAITLDDVSSQHGMPHFIKLDVEGSELAVLKGGPKTLASRPMVYFENDRDDRSEALLGHVMGQGYRCYWHLPPLEPGIVSINVLALPDEAQTLPVDDLTPIRTPQDRWQALIAA